MRFGIVHRDLKPENIFLEARADQPEFVKVLDFGIAKLLHAMPESTPLTGIGRRVGTLEYMSPEQLIGGPIDGRSDLYTLAVVAYEMLTGRRPFGVATGAMELITAQLREVPPPPSKVLSSVGVPSTLDAVLLTCLKRDRAARFATVNDMRDALQAISDG